MECQITDDENSAFAILSSIFIRMFYQNDSLNFYMPISKVDENFSRAKTLNAIQQQKFWFRVNVFEQSEGVYEELYLHEIMFGKDSVFEGLFAISSQIWEEFLANVYLENHQAC
jgi:Glutamate-cysteine ligase